jgi:hypothetical protein
MIRLVPSSSGEGPRVMQKDVPLGASPITVCTVGWLVGWLVGCLGGREACRWARRRSRSARSVGWLVVWEEGRLGKERRAPHFPWHPTSDHGLRG